MNLDGYIKRRKEEEKSPKTDITFSALDINCYENISDEKKELVRDMFSHIDDNEYFNIFDRWLFGSDVYGYYQSESENGTRGLVQIQIVDGGHSSLSEHYVCEEYNKGLKVGGQNYSSVYLIFHEKGSSINIFYVSDGNIFLDEGSALAMEKISVDELGDALADVCIEKEKARGIGKSKRNND